MVRPATGNVCVIIAARNAAETIPRAIGSALNEPEVGEVIVVDDGSTDSTAVAAATADDATRRLKVLSLNANRGPAFARNYAIETSSAPFIAILDADDFFIPGRFRNLLASDDWDFIADNVAFVSGNRPSDAIEITAFEADPTFLNLPAFVEGNIARRGLKRGEMGFLKPVMRRSFLDEHRLRYREDLRLGEDYDLYVRALARGARYKVLRSCGYGALVRTDSLSGQHRTADLERACAADHDILCTEPTLTPVEAAAIGRHRRHMRRRYEQRRFLDVKANSGLASAMTQSLRRPSALPGIAVDILSDKIEAARGRFYASAKTAACDDTIRYLLPGADIPR